MIKSFQAEYQRLRQLHDPDGQMTEDAFQTYLQAAGGFDKKTRVFGLGSVARELFVPPKHLVALFHQFSVVVHSQSHFPVRIEKSRTENEIVSATDSGGGG
jgi:hypothetical protein